MNIQQFEYILAVAEHRHFEEAAERCSISQSTLSTMILKFEDEIGIKIFDRKRKPLEVTLEGAAIIKQLKIISNNIHQLKETAKETRGEIKGTLTIAAIPTVAPFLLPLFLQKFALKFPELHLQVREQTSKEIIRQLKSRELDIGIISTPIEDDDLIELKLYDEPFVFYDGSATQQSPISAHKINLNNLWLMEEGHCMRTQVLNLCNNLKTKNNPSLNIDFKAGSIDSLLRFVKANKANTLLPYLSTLDFSEKEKQKLIPFKAPLPLRTIGLVVHKHFVKKKTLELFQKEIMLNITPILANVNCAGKVVSPV